MHPFKWYKYRTMILFTDTLKIKEKEIRKKKWCDQPFYSNE